MTHRPTIPWRAASACVLLWGCAEVTPPGDPICHPLVVPDAGAALPRIDCTVDPQCPPPLVCGPADGEGGATVCGFDPYGSEPDLLIEAFDRARLPLDLVDLPDGDGVLVQWQAPADAEQIRCVVTGCPWTRALALGGFERCVIVDVRREADLGDTITITPRTQSRPAELNPRTAVPTCGAGETELYFTAIELNLTCRAFSDVDLVAVSAIRRLTPGQLGRHRDRVVATDCGESPLSSGAACVAPTAGTGLGVCVGERCCTPCAMDDHCDGPNDRCRPVPGQPMSDMPGPFVGYCAGSCGAIDGGPPDAITDAMVDDISDAIPDAGVPDALPDDTMDAMDAMNGMDGMDGIDGMDNMDGMSDAAADGGTS